MPCVSPFEAHFNDFKYMTLWGCGTEKQKFMAKKF